MIKCSLEDIPSSVYRLQLSEYFPIKKAILLIPYLEALGIEGLYCSPIFLSCSSHGYDVLDPNRLNPLLGTMDEFDLLCSSLKEKKMKLILDIVPNHMSIKKAENKWWYDVLRYGRESSFASYFDINWDIEKKGLENKLLLPILEASYGYLLENQQIQLIFDQDFWIAYRDYKLPLSSRSLSLIREHGKETEDLLKLFNGTIGDSSSFELLHQLLEIQCFRLAYWKVAGQEINYRRFFDINELVAIHIENEKVLNEHHKWVFDLLTAKKVQGLRIDHPDGLYDPTEYFNRIKEKNPTLVIVEKILDCDESLPEDWNVNGTVGYDFLNILNGIFIQNKNEASIRSIYESFIGNTIDFKTLLYERKKVFVHRNMSSEIRFLGKLLSDLAEKNKYFRDFTKIELTLAVKEIIACFPVYRTYIRKEEPISHRDSKFIQEAIELAKNKTPEIDLSIYQYIKDIFLQDKQKDSIDFVLRFQQITSTVMAKGLEDSVCYIYNALLSVNEVGGSPLNFGFSKTEFHQYNKDQLAKWLGFLTTSTHDTKRSYDMRMRLNVLSEIPQEWQDILTLWKEVNCNFKTEIQGLSYPERNTEYYIYQQLLGMWPNEEEKGFQERFWNCILKAIRESGVYTSWRIPNPEYEEAVKRFVEAIFHEGKKFLPSFLNFEKKLALLGSYGSISGIILKMGSCGIVDIYQGNEWLTYSAQDPDNRPVLDEASCVLTQESMEKLFELILDGRLKQQLTALALNFRRDHKRLFLEGDYIPIKVQGELGEHVVAFMRKFDKEVAIFVVARYYNALLKDSIKPLGDVCWGKNTLEIPEELALHDLFTNISFSQQSIPLGKIFNSLPVAILTNVEVKP
ncbi:MAG: malto-oligosyltrehalose synthase [Chlamydiales bacterium]|nr:malto-oligosyltrehalose synthase [Chlamydiales bacterium]